MTIDPDQGPQPLFAANSPSFRKGAGRRVDVRAAVQDDAGLLHAVAAETFPLACPPDADQGSILAFIAHSLSEDAFDAYLADPARELFIAEVDHLAAGYAMVVHADPTDPDVVASVSARPTSELSKLYVRAAHHGAGVAVALVDAAVRASAARGSLSVWLGVNDENERANRFYEKSGFLKVGTKRFRLGERLESDFVRERRLG
ncbi:ribosomal protein S18 acetylase RimI-like enzyme [Salinibacterium sp. CAN_S4]|uniref:GNAT family N-acetyltransferase n=1 Tax=Salinibacterium sp. CAN_S4 TaxID=2787727 RepID=UPI001A1CB6DF